ENPPLARAMYAHAEVGSMLPEEFYRAIAEVLHYIYSKENAMAIK
ncbi:MAG: EscU/YscU/HrcU family type III secretion system export apparatus switch protein, partial [Pseudomonadota bacterium]